MAAATFNRLAGRSQRKGGILRSASAALIGLGVITGSSLTVFAGTASALTHTTTGVAFSANPAAYGASVTVTATVTDTSHTTPPTGTVAVADTTDATTPCAAAPLSPSGAFTATATCSFTPPVTGGTGRTISVSATYGGSVQFAGSTGSANLTVLGNGATTLTAGAHSPSVPVGTGDTLNATVSGSGPVPTGRVTFFVDGSPQSCTPSLNGSGKANCNWTPATAGTHAITFSCAGDSHYAANGPSGPYNVFVTGTGTATTATPTLVSPASPTAGSPITVSTTVSGGSPTPTGTVAFNATVGGSPVPACSAAALSGGSASCTFTPFSGTTGGTVMVSATYSGDTVYASSASPGSLSVLVTGSGAVSTFSLSSSKNPMTLGQTTTLSVQLTGSPTPTGSVVFSDGGTPLSCGSVTLNASGRASCADTPSSVGTHALVATYSGDGSYAPIGSSTPGYANHLSLVVNGLPATVSVASSANPTPYGSTVTLTATVSGSGPSPTGTVSFSATVNSATTTPCAAAPLSPAGAGSATATCSYSPPASGGSGVTASIVATYSGDSQYAGGSSSPYSLIEAGTAAVGSFTLTSSNPVALPGMAVNFTAQVTGSPLPTGTVSFTDNGTPILCGGTTYQVTILANGKATCAYTLVGPPGSHTIGATYSGNPTYAATSTTAAQTVAQAPAITSSPTTTFTVGSFGTFTVTTSGAPTPALSETGALPSGVSFVDNGNGTATVSGTPAAGTGGDYVLGLTASNGFTPNGTQSFTLVVDQAPAFTSANATTFAVGAGGMFTVSASGFPTAALFETGALPSGVSFVDNGNGTATLSGTPAVGTGGVYSLSLRASNGVSPDAHQTFTLTVDEAPAITSGDATTFTIGSAGAFTVTTTGQPTPALSESGPLPSGVTLVDNGDGTASLSGIPGPGTGGTWPFSITAANGVSPDATQDFTLTVDTIGSGTALSSSANPSAYGAAVTLTATVTGQPGEGAPTGTVDITDLTDSVDACGGPVTLTPSGSDTATASCSYTPPVTGNLGGSFSFEADYSGDTTYNASSGSFTQQVFGNVRPNMTLQFSPNPAPYGATVTVTGTVVDPNGITPPPGTVTFTDTTDNLVICGPLTLSPTGPGTSGASCSYNPPGSGGVGVAITAASSYSGDLSGYEFSPYTITRKFAENGSGSTTLTAGAHSPSVVVGNGVSLRATVAGGGPVPTGKVTFFVNGSPLSCTPLLNASGQAGCIYTPTSTGTQAVTFSYAGDVNYAANGPSAPYDLLVTGAGTASLTTPVASPAQPAYGAPVTVSTTVSGGSGTPTGTVDFSATFGSSTVDECPAAPVDGSGNASCTFTPGFTGGTGGTVRVTPTYSGDGTYATATGRALSFLVTGTGTPGSFSLTSSMNPAPAGTRVTFTALLGGSPTPTGSVTFTDNGTPVCTSTLNASGRATCADTLVGTGNHSIVAAYSGDAVYAPQSASLTQQAT
jgi:hypothetical protein